MRLLLLCRSAVISIRFGAPATYHLRLGETPIQATVPICLFCCRSNRLIALAARAALQLYGRTNNS
jgi:hypothetical protein